MATQKEVADHLDISDRQVRRYLDSGVFPKAKNQRGLDLDKCRIAYITHLRNGGAEKADIGPESDPDSVVVGGINVSFEDARRKRANADLAEEKVFQARRTHAPVWLIREALQQVSASLAAQLSAMPNKLRLACPDLTVPQIEAMQKEIARIRNECTDIRPDLSGYVVGDSGGSDEGAEAP
ncbi:hypothetical protein ABMA58_00125 [Oceanospirillum sp. HFRX-1_2]